MPDAVAAGRRRPGGMKPWRDLPTSAPCQDLTRSARLTAALAQPRVPPGGSGLPTCKRVRVKAAAARPGTVAAITCIVEARRRFASVFRPCSGLPLHAAACARL